MDPRFSIVVPMKNEAENATTLVEEIVEACGGLGTYEIWIVDDGSTDDTRAVLEDLGSRFPVVRFARHETSAGQSAAIHTGILQARAPLICTLDGDGQNPPDEIPNVLEPLLRADAPGSLALVAGERVGRKDTWWVAGTP
jgi:dolichol-phosphate mannosyltransferase